MEKLSEYQGFTGRFHAIRDSFKEKAKHWKDEASTVDIKAVFDAHKAPKRESDDGETNKGKYSHIFRKKKWHELVRISAAVMGIEFSYAAETAFVSPTLLQIGVDHTKMTMVWALSPMVGFFLTPVLGSLSDRCSSRFGRRRPFLMLLSIGILLGLILIPNGKNLGEYLGDSFPGSINYNATCLNETVFTDECQPPDHTWGVFFVILGTLLLDFDADACQSPARAYLLDVTIPEDHARGLSTFTIMGGLGGFVGYSMGAFNWDVTILGQLLGGHVKAAFTIITIIFIICLILTISSFPEIPLDNLEEEIKLHKQLAVDYHEETPIPKGRDTYGTVSTAGLVATEQDTSFGTDVQTQNIKSVQSKEDAHSSQDVSDVSPSREEVVTNPSLKDYLLSIIHMPNSLRILCLTNLFCWMAHVCYSLNFTDYVGEAVFNGDPSAVEGSKEYLLYEEGVRFGCWGMSMYSLSCSCYSLIIEKLIKRFKAKKVYVGGIAFFGVGMLIMALLKNKAAVIIFSGTAGVMYSTLFTMPYLLIAHYHSLNKFDNSETEVQQARGLGTDIALVGSMVFLAQFTLSLFIGSLVSASGTTTVYVLASALFSFCGSVCATQVLYLDI